MYRPVQATMALLIALAACSGSSSSPSEPSSGPVLIARGNIVYHDFFGRVEGRVEFEATREGSNGNTNGSGYSVTGRMTWPDAGDSTIDLQCARTEDGLLMIGGYITDTTFYDQGTLAAIGLDRERPMEAWVLVGSNGIPGSATETTSCLAYLDAWVPFPAGYGLRPIMSGTIEFGP